MTRTTIDFGIDLGTTNSAIAVLRDGVPQPLRNNDQSELTPSSVMVDKNRVITVGKLAYNQAEYRSDRVAREFKRSMGSDRTFTVSGEAWTPEQLSAEVLKTLRADAFNRLGEDVHAAVITVPAMFTLAQCEATGRAAALAGIVQAPLLQEPIAAGIAYGVQAAAMDGYWIVYDLGGGTFDASLMTLREGRLKVLDHGGDEYMGGKNLDDALLDYVVDQLRPDHTIDGLVRRDDRHRRLYASLKARCEEARIYLSRQQETSIEISNVQDDAGDEIDAEITISRRTLEQLIAPHITQTLQVVNQLLDRNSLQTRMVRRVLMLGGPTLTPYVRARVAGDLGIELETSIDPMTAVAQGAAIYAGSILREDTHRSTTSATAGTVQIAMKYSPVSEETDALVGGRVHDSAPQGLVIQLDRSDGGWSSGRIRISNSTFVSTVSLRSRQANVFVLKGFDGDGRAVPMSPDQIVITHGLVVEEPPLSRSLGVAVDDGAGEQRVKVLLSHGRLGDPLKPIKRWMHDGARPTSLSW